MTSTLSVHGPAPAGPHGPLGHGLDAVQVGVLGFEYGYSLERPDALVMSLVLTAGIGVFALAMWWDRSDRVRQTRRSDVAFWLHLLAAPMIAHPIFHLLGVTEGNDIGSGAAVMVVGIYVLFGLLGAVVSGLLTAFPIELVVALGLA